MRRRRSREDRFDEETVFEQQASLIPYRYKSSIYSAIGIFGLFKNDIDAESTYAQRCPKCDRHTLVRVRAGDPKSPWKCNRCGNDSDEFGNKL